MRTLYLLYTEYDSGLIGSPKFVHVNLRISYIIAKAKAEVDQVNSVNSLSTIHQIWFWINRMYWSLKIVHVNLIVSKNTGIDKIQIILISSESVHAKTSSYNSSPSKYFGWQAVSKKCRRWANQEQLMNKFCGVFTFAAARKWLINPPLTAAKL